VVLHGTVGMSAKHGDIEKQSIDRFLKIKTDQVIAYFKLTTNAAWVINA
jgi:hypothetical protein